MIRGSPPLAVTTTRVGAVPIAEALRVAGIRSAVGGCAHSAVQGPSCSANVPDPIKTMESATARRRAIAEPIGAVLLR